MSERNMTNNKNIYKSSKIKKALINCIKKCREEIGLIIKRYINRAKTKKTLIYIEYKKLKKKIEG